MNYLNNILSIFRLFVVFGLQNRLGCPFEVVGGLERKGIIRSWLDREGIIHFPREKEGIILLLRHPLRSPKSAYRRHPGPPQETRLQSLTRLHRLPRFLLRDPSILFCDRRF